jgi:hypothetical protein
MSKFKIEKGISRITRVKLQATIEEAIAADLALLGEWSNNDKNYIVNELLRFALSQDSEFQAYKGSIGSSRPEPRASGATSAVQPRAIPLFGESSPNVSSTILPSTPNWSLK